jgi:hypothetical protein
VPNVDGELVSPDDVIRRGLCPECGKRLDIKSARHHAEDHWGIDPNSNRLSEEGRRRFNLILGFVGGKIGQPAMPETPSHDNRAFWIDQIIAGVIFAAGFDIMRDHLVLGLIVSALGLGCKIACAGS